MEWSSKNWAFSEKDLNAFTFMPGSSTVMTRLSTDMCWKVTELTSDNEWAEWIERELPGGQEKSVSGLCLVLCRNAGSGRGRKADLYRVPFSRDTFKLVSNAFWVHRGISRAIDREDACFESIIDQYASRESPAIGFVARMSSAMSTGGLALAGGFLPDCGLTFGMVFGCSPEQTLDFKNRLQEPYQTFLHPMLAAGIFFELDRYRLVPEIEESVLTSVHTLTKLRIGGPDLAATMNQDGINMSLEDKADQLNTTNALKQSREAIEKLIKFTEELSVARDLTDRDPKTFTPGIQGMPIYVLPKTEPSRKKQLIIDGHRIQERLRNIAAEFDRKLDECNVYTKHLSDSMHMRFTQANVNMAAETSRDGQYTRALAHSMALLWGAATALAILPNLGIPMQRENVWLYVVVFVVGTVAAVGGSQVCCWYLKRRKGGLNQQHWSVV